MIGRVAIAIVCLLVFSASHALRAGPRESVISSGPAIFAKKDMKAVNLGRFLFFDPVLSGNKNIACATCHHPKFGTSDGVSLAIGEGGVGLGPDRHPGTGNNMPEQRIGRNAPALFNLGATEFTSLFHDGRLEAGAQHIAGIRTPLEDDMIAGFDSVLAAQAMFPVLSADEMAGHYGENDVSKAVRQGLLTRDGGAWDIIAERVRSIPVYASQFVSIYPKIHTPADIAFSDIANAIAAFVAFEFRADDSPFDRHMRTGESLKETSHNGMKLFYGKAGCGACHSGLFQTDHTFHAIAMPQIGPGKTARFESAHRDTGRMRVTGQSSDIYKFRTPSLRNVTLTAPYGHSGAYATLEAVVRHHLEPVEMLYSYERGQVILPEFPDASDWTVLDDSVEIAAIAAANTLAPVTLSNDEIRQLLSFLGDLTDPISLTGRLGVPEQVPSGLPMD